LPVEFTELGPQQVKNIAQPIQAYRIRSEISPTAIPVIGSSLPLPDKPSIAVLPFQNMSGDPEQEYFADGMVEEIITALSRIRWLFVIARNSSFTYQDLLAINGKSVRFDVSVTGDIHLCARQRSIKTPLHTFLMFTICWRRPAERVQTCWEKTRNFSGLDMFTSSRSRLRSSSRPLRGFAPAPFFV
jgi:hypothetical protein